MTEVRAALRLIGKTGEKAVVIFAGSRLSADVMIRHVRKGIPDLPLWVFSIDEPSADAAALCQRVVTGRHASLLLFSAQRQLWPHWVALASANWTGERGPWLLKLAPFFFPPFRIVLHNECGDFFGGSPSSVFSHARRRSRNKALSAWRRAREIYRGAWIFLFAFVAQWFAFLSRYVFVRLPKGGPLDVAVEPGPAAGITRIEYENIDWDADVVGYHLDRTAARWVLFEESRKRDAIEDLLPLFADPRTFAVARQEGHRAWRKLLVATAPFRALEPGEAARVLAPLSDTVVVDRQKLLALGIPKTMAVGSAFLILCWKAAAAGWNCYSVGSTRRIGELPDRSFEEAEFVKSLLADPALKPLAPREPDLARGSISFSAAAFSAAPARRYRGNPRVLVLSPYLPYPLSHGGAVRIYNLCRALSGRFDFILACFREKEDHTNYEKLHEIFREVRVVDIDEKHADAELPRQVNEYESRGMRALVKELCETREIDVLQVEYTQMAAYRDAAPHVPAILVEHDLTFMLHRQLAGHDATPAARDEYEKWLRFERRWLAAYDAVWTMSDSDRQLAIDEGSAAERTFVVPNGVDLERFRSAPAFAGPPQILYVGSFRHRPNLLGFDELRERIMPAVWQRFPQARLRVVGGPDHEKHWRIKAIDPRIEVHGFIQELIPFYVTASLVVVPLPVSAGTNIKVMEALACERAVVSTPVGCNGLGLMDGEDVLIRDLGASFAEGVCALLGDEALRARIARQGRLTAEASFGWDAIANHACETYEQLSGVAAR